MGFVVLSLLFASQDKSCYPCFLPEAGGVWILDQAEESEYRCEGTQLTWGSVRIQRTPTRGSRRIGAGYRGMVFQWVQITRRKTLTQTER